MTTNSYTFAVLGVLAGTLLAGCDKTAEQKTESANAQIGQAMQDSTTVRAERAKEWLEFKAESVQQIADNDKRIEAFEAKMDKAGAKAKAKYSKEIKELKRKNQELREKLEDFKDGERGRWEEFKTNFKHDMDGIGKTMKDLFKDKD
jgi:chromosome segregation ATPase